MQSDCLAEMAGSPLGNHQGGSLGLQAWAVAEHAVAVEAADIADIAVNVAVHIAEGAVGMAAVGLGAAHKVEGR